MPMVLELRKIKKKRRPSIARPLTRVRRRLKYLGGRYTDGKGVVKDHKEAATWFRKAADQGHPDAQYYLGGRYDKGNGVLKDMKEAIAWYRKAAAPRSCMTLNLI